MRRPPDAPLCVRCAEHRPVDPDVEPLCGTCRSADRRRAESAERRRLPIPRGQPRRTDDEQTDAAEKVRWWKHMTDEERAAAVRDALR
jgi:hypothetical protein